MPVNASKLISERKKKNEWRRSSNPGPVRAGEYGGGGKGPLSRSPRTGVREVKARTELSNPADDGGGRGPGPGPCRVCTFLLRRGTALLGSMANPISARFCRTDFAWSQACRMWELKTERARSCHLAGRPGRGPRPPEPGPPHHSIRGAAFRRAFRFRRFRLTL